MNDAFSGSANFVPETDCSCGRQHVCPIRTMVYDEQAIAKLPEILSKFVVGRQVTLLADLRTFPVAGEDAERCLKKEGWSVRTLIVPDADHGGPICDDRTHDSIRSNIQATDIFVAVGSGVISDLTKWIAFDLKKPYVAIATAASMNGYSAANVAPTIDGIKSIIYAQAPSAIFAIPSIIENAPYELTASGFGDVIAKPVSTADWVMNHLLFGEYFCPRCSEMIASLEPYYLNRPQTILERRPEAIEALYQALIYSGVAMTLVGTSAPASGGEHMLSHTLDMMSNVDGFPHDLHGRQVGLGTVFASALYERIFEIDRLEPRRMTETIDRRFWGPLADPVADQYAQKQRHLQIMRENLSDRNAWDALLSAVREKVRPAQQIRESLQKAGAAYRASDIECSRKRLLDAVLHMHEIRKRCTVVDLAWMVGVLPDQAEDLVDRWLT